MEGALGPVQPWPHLSGAVAWPAAPTPLLPPRASVLVSKPALSSPCSAPQSHHQGLWALPSHACPSPLPLGAPVAPGPLLPHPLSHCPVRSRSGGQVPSSPSGTTASPGPRPRHSEPWRPVRPRPPHSPPAHPGPAQPGCQAAPTPAHFSQAPCSLPAGLECHVHHPRLQPGPLGLCPGPLGVHVPPRKAIQLGGAFPAHGDQGGSWRAVLTGRARGGQQGARGWGLDKQVAQGRRECPEGRHRAEAHKSWGPHPSRAPPPSILGLAAAPGRCPSRPTVLCGGPCAQAVGPEGGAAGTSVPSQLWSPLLQVGSCPRPSLTHRDPSHTDRRGGQEGGC